MKLRNLDRFTPFAAGLAVGVTATLLFVPEAGGDTRNHIRNAARRVGDGLKAGVENLGHAAVGVPSEEITADIENGRRKTMSDLKDKAKQNIDDAAAAAKKAADKAVDKSKDVAHSAGKKMEEGGKRLQDA